MYRKRSQSSFRAKTQQSEDSSLENQWITGNNKAKKILNKVNQKIVSSSMIEHQKENSSVNLPNYQSVTDEQDHDLIISLQQKCKKYEKELTEFYQGKNQRKKYQYEVRFYEDEVRELKNEIQEKNQELQRYQNLYSSKRDELEDAASEISSRIEKNQAEKNLYIKEINVKNIEIKKLRQTNDLYKSEKENLKILIREQKGTVEELLGKAQQYERQKNKIENYEIQLKESHISLKDIEHQLEKIVEEAHEKDLTIQQNSRLILELMNKIETYEQQIKLLEDSVNLLKENKHEKQKYKIEKEQECHELKEQCFQLRKQIQMIPQYEIKLKNCYGTIDDLRGRNKELIATNEKLKMDFLNFKTIQSRVIQLDQENSLLKKEKKEKDEKLQFMENQGSTSKKLQEESKQIKYKIRQFQNMISEKEKQAKILSQKLVQQEKNNYKLFQQLQNEKEETKKLKEEKKEKIETLFHDNSNLRSNLLEKIDEIEELQRKLTNIQSKYTQVVNENNKHKAILEGRQQQIKELNAKVDTLKSRWQTQMSTRINLQENCMSLENEKKRKDETIKELEEMIKSQNQRAEQLNAQFDNSKKQLYFEIEQMNQYKIEAEKNLDQSRLRIKDFQRNVENLRDEIQEMTEKQQYHQTCMKNLEEKIKQLTLDLEKSSKRIKQMREIGFEVRRLNQKMLSLQDQKILE